MSNEDVNRDFQAKHNLTDEQMKWIEYVTRNKRTWRTFNQEFPVSKQLDSEETDNESAD